MSAFAIYQHPAMDLVGYEEKPWFLPGRRQAFLEEFERRRLTPRARFVETSPASDEDLLRFHTPAHLERVRRLCAADEGALDHGATLARRGMEIGATHMVGAGVQAARDILAGKVKRVFVPVGGFHHAFPDTARMYCLYNDAAVILALLRSEGLARIAYIDIDVHHGDGVYLGFAADDGVAIVDLHEDGRTLWPHSPEQPGTEPVSGERDWVGEGAGAGLKMNRPLSAGTGDAGFLRVWEEAEEFLEEFAPEFVVYLAGVDGLAGDPMAHLALTEAVYGEITRRVRGLADRHAEGRVLALAGGGYDVTAYPGGWCAVAEGLL